MAEISVCKNADQKEEIHTEVTKIAKEWMPRIEGAPNPKSVLATFAIPVCKNADQKEEFTRRSQRSQRKGRSRIEGPQSKSVSATSVCKFSFNAAQVKRDALLTRNVERRTPNAEVNVDVYLSRVFSRVAV